MRCTDPRGPAGGLGAGLLLLLGGCSPSGPASAPASAPVAVPVAVPSAPTGGGSSAVEPPHPPVPAGARPVARGLPLPQPLPVASWDEVRRQAAHRLVAANPDGTYLGPVPEPLLAIPVLEIELKRDGSVARIVILRAPRQARDTSALAIAAVHRAAPFGDVSRLPRPWRFTETFLFDGARKFKPRTLDE